MTKTAIKAMPKCEIHSTTSGWEQQKIKTRKDKRDEEASTKRVKKSNWETMRRPFYWALESANLHGRKAFSTMLYTCIYNTIDMYYRLSFQRSHWRRRCSFYSFCYAHWHIHTKCTTKNATCPYALTFSLRCVYLAMSLPVRWQHACIYVMFNSIFYIHLVYALFSLCIFNVGDSLFITIKMKLMTSIVYVKGVMFQR